MNKMKTITKFLTAGLLIIAFSCSKDDDGTILTSDDIADIVALSLAENTSGLSSTLEDISTITNIATAYVNSAVSTSSIDELKSTSACGYSKDTIISRSGTDGALISYNYNYSYNFALNCSNLGMPENMSAELSYNGLFSAPRMESTNNGLATMTMEGLELSDGNYSINGVYERNGSFESKIRNRNKFSSQLQFTLTNVFVNKNTFNIESGTAQAAISGTDSQNHSFSFIASITFNGDGTAHVVINGGVYTVNLEDGSLE